MMIAPSLSTLSEPRGVSPGATHDRGTPVLFFIVFLLSRRVAERLWLVLVVYTELTLLAQFLWQFPFAAGVANNNAIALIFGRGPNPLIVAMLPCTLTRWPHRRHGEL